MEKVDVDYVDGLKLLYRTNSTRRKGLLVVTAAETNRANIMTFGAWHVSLIDPHGWCFVMHVWEERYTHLLIGRNGEFTVNIPREGMKDILAYCGKVSGRGHDKFKELNLTAVRSRHVTPPIIGECGVHLECRTINKYSVMEGHEREGVRPAKATAFQGRILSVYADEDIAEDLKQES